MAEKLCELKKKGGGGSSVEIKEVAIASSNSNAARSFDVSAILPNDYQNLTVDNFYIKNASIAYISGSAAKDNPIIGSYDPSTGILSCNVSRWSAGNYIFYIEYSIVAVFLGGI